MSDLLPVPHPVLQAEVEAIAQLRDELAQLLTEAHDLEHLTRPHLLALYQTRIGAWELGLLRVQTDVARLKRQIELLQASLNQGQPPDLAAIEARLETEFLTWQTRLAEAAAKLQQAEWRLTHVLSAEDDREFKRLYRQLARRLHPDVNPDNSEDAKRLWLRVQAAYEAGDAGELQALALLAERPDPAADAPPPSSDRLARQRETLERQITATEREIERILAAPPFPMREQLADDAWVEARRAELEERTAAAQAQRAALEAHLQTLLPTTTHGPIFGLN